MNPNVNIYNKETLMESLYGWSREYRTIRGERFSLDGHIYLREPYSLATYKQKIVFKKSAQCGITELLINLAIWTCERKNNCLFIFPTEGDVSDFSRARVSSVIQTDPYIKGLVEDTDNVGLKRIGRGFCYFRGSRQRSKLKSIDADLIIMDEVDEFEQSNIPLALKRLDHSKLKWIRIASTPTYPGFGIDIEYETTDQREWYIKCGKCRREQPLDFWDNLRWEEVDGVIANTQTICKYCGSILDRLSRGVWKAKYPERDTVGYHINKLMCLRTDLNEIVENSKKIDPFAVQEFYNSDLGLPYVPKGEQIDRSVLDSCKADYLMPGTGDRCTMGVDVGTVLHVRVSKWENNIRRAMYIGTAATFEELERIMHRYDVCSCVIDALPETRKVMEFAETFKGKVYRCYYSDSQKKSIAYTVAGEDIYQITVNRTWSLDVSQGVIVNRERNLLPCNIDTILDYYKQMGALVRVVSDTAVGGKIARYINGGKADHYRHAENYDVLAKEIMLPNQDISGGLEEEAGISAGITQGVTGRHFAVSTERVFGSKIALSGRSSVPMSIGAGEGAEVLCVKQDLFGLRGREDGY